MCSRSLIQFLLVFHMTAGILLWPGSSEISAPNPNAPTPTCQACGLPIHGVYYKIPGLPDLYCEKCNKTLPHCFFCGRPVKEETVGGKIICKECQVEVVRDPQEARRLAGQVKDWIQDHLHLRLPSQVCFQYVKDLAPYLGTQLLGTTRELGAFFREGEEVRILLINEMPRATLIETVAHELAHVWQNGRIPKNQRLLIKEGFAQWVASKVLNAFKCVQALKVLQEREDMYGQGYRHVQKIENRSGVPAVIEYAKRQE
jgi:hypothetical protein